MANAILRDHALSADESSAGITAIKLYALARAAAQRRRVAGAAAMQPRTDRCAAALQVAKSLSMGALFAPIDARDVVLRHHYAAQDRL